MGKKTGKRIDRLSGDVRVLSETVSALRDQIRTGAAADAAINDAKSRNRPKPDDSNAPGIVSASGSWSGRHHSGETWTARWQQQGSDPGDLDTAAHTLAAIGHRQRLSIVLALLEQPASVGDLVATLVLGTSGAAYHHLNVLAAAGFVEQRERGIWEIAPARIGSLLGVFAALTAETTVDTESTHPE